MSKAKITEQTIEQSVSHKFTELEMTALQRKIAKDVQALRTAEEKKKSIMSDFTSQINEAKAMLNSTAVLVNQGYEYRRMECKVIFNWETGIKTTIHPETGEVIGETKISPQERQTLIDIEQRKK